MHIAVEAGFADIVQVLLNKGADANALNADGNTPIELLRQAMTEHWNAGKTIPPSYVQVGESLALAGATIEGQNLRDTIMHRFAFGYTYDEAKRFLERGANVNGVNEEGETPLHMAVFAGTTERVQLFLEYGADVRATDFFGKTPLHDAAAGGHVETVKLLLAWGADVRAVDEGGSTALHKAAEGSTRDLHRMFMDSNQVPMAADFPETVRLLLNAGAEVDAMDQRGNTPLHMSSSEAYQDVSEVLLAHGANINAVNADGKSPLNRALQGLEIREELATRRGRGKLYPTQVKELDRYADFVDWLTAKGAVKGPNQGSPPEPCDETDEAEEPTTVFNVRTAEDLQLLLQAGANVNALDDDKRTPLHRAAEEGRGAVVRALLQNGAKPNARDTLGETPLHAAAEQGRSDAALALLDAGADPNAKNRSDYAPLHTLVSSRSFWEMSEPGESGDPGRDYVRTATTLLEHNATVDAKAEQGMTPLHFAVSNGDLELVSVLVAAGANVHTRTATGFTPLHLAASGKDGWPEDSPHGGTMRNYRDIARLLLERGVEANVMGDWVATPLCSAAISCNRSVAEVLLDRGADINADCHHGETPLASARRGLRDSQRMAPYMPADDLTARKECFEKMIAWLEQRGAKD